MAKNTGDTKFRKVDVDQYAESAFQDEQEDGGSTTVFNEAEINNPISRGKYADAVLLLLQNAPIKSKDQTVKDTAFKLMMRALSHFKSQDIDDFVANLDQNKIDLLMKYIYRGFKQPSEATSATLLTWHEKVHAKGQAGCIIRVLTDRNRV